MARPSEFEQRRRRREFWRVLAATGSVVKATAGSGLSEAQVLRLLEPRESLSAALELVEARAS